MIRILTGFLVFVVAFGRAANALATTYVSTNFAGVIADEKVLAEIRLTGARDHTFVYNGETRRCGVSYEAVVKETFRGALPATVTFTSVLSMPEDSHLWEGSGREELVPGESYVVSLEEGAEHKSASWYIEHSKGTSVTPLGSKKSYKIKWDSGWQSLAAAECLAGLSENRIGFRLHIVRQTISETALALDKDIGKFFDRRKCQDSYKGRICSRELVELGASLLVPGDLIVGARADLRFVRTEAIDKNARAYLSTDGGFSMPNEAGEDPHNGWGGKPYFLKKIGATGPFFSNLVLYDGLKPILRGEVKPSKP